MVFIYPCQKTKRQLCIGKEDIPVDRVRGAPEDTLNEGEDESDMDFE